MNSKGLLGRGGGQPMSTLFPDASALAATWNAVSNMEPPNGNAVPWKFMVLVLRRPASSVPANTGIAT